MSNMSIYNNLSYTQSINQKPYDNTKLYNNSGASIQSEKPTDEIKNTTISRFALAALITAVAAALVAATIFTGMLGVPILAGVGLAAVAGISFTLFVIVTIRRFSDKTHDAHKHYDSKIDTRILTSSVKKNDYKPNNTNNTNNTEITIQSSITNFNTNFINNKSNANCHNYNKDLDIKKLYTEEENLALTQIDDIIVKNCLQENNNSFFDRVIGNFSAESNNNQMQLALFNKIFNIESYNYLEKVDNHTIVDIFVGLLKRILLLNKDNYNDNIVELQGMIEDAFPLCKDERINTISVFLLTLLEYKLQSIL